VLDDAASLKLPVIPDMAGMLAATTLPCVLPGGDPGDPGRPGAPWQDALAQPQIRGVVVGRSVLYPPDDDVAGAARRLAGLLAETGR
jgi:Cgl0159-like